MSSWRAMHNSQPAYHGHRASFSSTCSQEADGGGGRHEQQQQKMAAPSSPVFDLDEFIYDPSSTTSTTTAGAGGISGLPDVAQLGSATHAHHANGHSWTTSGGDATGWDSVSNVFQESATNAFYGISFTASAGTHSKPSLKTTSSPQSILNNYYNSGVSSFPQPATSGFSDYELGLDSSSGADLLAFPTKTDTMADQHQQHSMFDQGLYSDMNKMMLLSQSEPAYSYATLNAQPQAQQHQHQRRGSVRHDSTPSIPFSTATSFPLNIQVPSFSYTQPSTVFPAHTPSSSLSSSSFLSNLSPTSPLGSPHFSDRGLSISPSIPPVSPLSASAVGAIYFHQGPGTSPTPSFGGVPPAQLSASPHQFSSAPITFVNQTSQFTKLANTASTTRDSSPKDADVDEYLPSMNERRQGLGDDMRQRKRRRTLSNSVMGEESDDKRDEDIPIKSELRPPKQAPSMWQVYFADWLQDHKTRHPHDKLNVAQAAKEAGQLYKTLTEAEKEDLKRRVQIEKQSREQRLSAWQRTLTPNDIKRENKFRAAQRKAGLSRRANIKDPNAPKKPLSAYFMFLAKIRSDPRLVDEVFGGETETTRQSVLAAQTWREMSDEEKKPFLTQAEHDKIQYEALRKIYEEQAGSGHVSSSSARKQMAAGTGYIVPQQMTLSDDVTASILSANPNTGNRYSSHGGSDSDDLHMVSYDPQATVRKSSMTASSKAIAAAAAASFLANNGKMTSSSIPVSFSATGTVRRRAAAARKSARQVMMDDGAQSPPDSSEDDDEWVPGKSV